MHGLADPAFDLRFNFLGGGDTDFFLRCRQAGMKFHWVAEAVITETVPDSRTNPGWLVLRGLRIGAINYHIERKAAKTAWSRMGLFAKMFAMLPMSLFRAGRLVFTEHKAVIAMHPMIVAAGSALAAFGIEPQPYKASKIDIVSQLVTALTFARVRCEHDDSRPRRSFLPAVRRPAADPARFRLRE